MQQIIVGDISLEPPGQTPGELVIPGLLPFKKIHRHPVHKGRRVFRNRQVAVSVGIRGSNLCLDALVPQGFARVQDHPGWPTITSSNRGNHVQDLHVISRPRFLNTSRAISTICVAPHSGVRVEALILALAAKPGICSWCSENQTIRSYN